MIHGPKITNYICMHHLVVEPGAAQPLGERGGRLGPPNIVGPSKLISHINRSAIYM